MIEPGDGRSAGREAVWIETLRAAVPELPQAYTGLLLAIGLVVKFYGATPNPLEEKLLELVPGANCGACGFAGCNDYVQAMVSGKAKPGLCPSQSADALQKVCVLLGVASEGRAEKVAVDCNPPAGV